MHSHVQAIAPTLTCTFKYNNIIYLCAPIKHNCLMCLSNGVKHSNGFMTTHFPREEKALGILTASDGILRTVTWNVMTSFATTWLDIPVCESFKCQY